MFVPADKQYGAPRVTVAGVNPLMTQTAGEVADGFVAHGFTTERYFTEVTLPALERGLASPTIFVIDVTCDFRFPPYDLARAAAELG